MKQTLYRHGDLALTQIEKLPDNLKKSNTKVLMTGSHRNDHKIDKGDVYFKNVGQYIFGYLVAKNTKLFHKEHGNQWIRNNHKKSEYLGNNTKVAKIENGIYELRKQQEFVNKELIPIID